MSSLASTRRPFAVARRGVAALSAVAAILLAGVGGCGDALPHNGGRTLAHRYRGVLDDDLGVTPRTTDEPLAGADADAGDAPAAGDRYVNLGSAPRSNRRASRDHARQPEPAPRADPDPVGGDDPFSDSTPAVKVVNVFGEMGEPPRAAGPAESAFKRHTFTEQGADADVCVDPTGKLLVYSSTRHGERSDLYMQRVDGASVVELTSEAGSAAYPCFSPDGRRIAFASTRSGLWQIYVMEASGANVVQVTDGTMQCIHPSFGPDGNRLVYAALGPRGVQWELWTIDLTSSDKKMVGYGLFPRWSPGRGADRIAFQRATQRGGRWFSVWTMDLVDGEGRRLTEVAASANAALVSPAWSPDGRRLAITSILHPNAKPGGQTPQRGREDIWSLNADGTDRQRLTDGRGSALSAWWSADGRVYFTSDRGGSENIWSAPAGLGRGADFAGAGALQGAGAPKDAAAVADPGDAER